MVYEYYADVIDVYDSDTITVSVMLGFNISIILKCRLYGINGPELRTKDDDEKRRGYLARDYLRERILNKEVILKTYKPDKYGRVLAEVYLDDIHINAELIEKGHAVPYFGGKR